MQRNEEGVDWKGQFTQISTWPWSYLAMQIGFMRRAFEMNFICD